MTVSFGQIWLVHIMHELCAFTGCFMICICAFDLKLLLIIRGGEPEENSMAPALAPAPCLFELMTTALAPNFFELMALAPNFFRLLEITFKNFNYIFYALKKNYFGDIL